REGDAQDEFSNAKYAVTEPFQIPPGHYFLLGDCRDNSLDSRYWGTVPRELIVGKALMIVGSSASSGQERAFKRLK
ncbi:MAG: signal peptidase I, partial [Blastocatellia bacterium]